MFDGGLLEHLDARETAEVLLQLLRALVLSNLRWLEEHPDTPHPYQAGIQYTREARGSERWKSINKVLREGGGDCEDLAAYLCAWLVHHEGRASVVLRWAVMPSGARVYHVLTRKRDGTYEDPSKALGMKGEA